LIIRLVYSAELAYVHDAGFGDFAEHAAPELIRLLHAHHTPPTTRAGRATKVVEMGCGSGRLARRLTDAGYDVLGFDMSPAMIALARANAPKARFRVAALTEARIPRCAAVVSVGEVITYVPAGDPGSELPRGLRVFFSRVHAALISGGVFIFDFLDSGKRRTYPPTSRGGGDWVMASQASLDRSGRVLTRRIVTIRNVGRQFRRSQETHVVRIYSRGAVARALAAAGFSSQMSRSYGHFRLKPGGVAVIAEKERG
jgi:SAM-dependent methyltransferase